jgi:hypothetical protein
MPMLAFHQAVMGDSRSSYHHHLTKQNLDSFSFYHWVVQRVLTLGAETNFIISVH